MWKFCTWFCIPNFPEQSLIRIILSCDYLSCEGMEIQILACLYHFLKLNKGTTLNCPFFSFYASVVHLAEL